MSWKDTKHCHKAVRILQVFQKCRVIYNLPSSTVEERFGLARAAARRSLWVTKRYWNRTNIRKSTVYTAACVHQHLDIIVQNLLDNSLVLLVRQRLLCWPQRYGSVAIALFGIIHLKNKEKKTRFYQVEEEWRHMKYLTEFYFDFNRDIMVWYSTFCVFRRKCSWTLLHCYFLVTQERNNRVGVYFPQMKCVPMQ